MKNSLKMKLYGISAAALFVFTVTQIQTFSMNRARVNSDEYYNPRYYYVKEYQGKVAVFAENKKIPDEVYDVYIDSLPEKDKKLLQHGLRAKNEEELQQLIEDYTG